MNRTHPLSFAFVLALGACDIEEPSFELDDHEVDAAGGAEPADGPAPPPGRAQVWETCGDPACSGWRPKGYPRCPQRVQPGLACPDRLVGEFCDPIDDCNVLYTCDTVDPTGGDPCPISRRDAKADIAYLEAAEAQRLADELLAYRLATYRYVASGDEGPTRLGFIIDDVAPSPSVLPNGNQVDLYAYTTMAVATLQVQQRQIARLEAELAALRDELRARDARP